MHYNNVPQTEASCYVIYPHKDLQICLKCGLRRQDQNIILNKNSVTTVTHRYYFNKHYTQTTKEFGKLKQLVPVSNKLYTKEHVFLGWCTTKVSVLLSVMINKFGKTSQK